MFTIVSVGLYAGILWVLGLLVLRERRRARDLDRLQTGMLGRAMSSDDRP